MAAATPSYKFAGNWTWSISCPDTIFSYWSFQKITGEGFTWSWAGGIPGNVSGRINGDRMSFRQQWAAADGTKYDANISLTATGDDTFTGNGNVNGFSSFPLSRSCSMKMFKAF